MDQRGDPVWQRVEGRIEFRGPSVTAGYFRNPEATRAALREGWMDSGDLGYLAGGELFVTGRRKELIIRGGRNIYPQEIEEVVGEIPGIRKGCVVAFGAAHPEMRTERLVVVAESRETTSEARKRLSASAVKRVVAAVGIRPDLVVIVGPGSVPKTSSGKLRRGATREVYLLGCLGTRPPALTQWARVLAAGLAGRLARLAARGLRQSPSDPMMAGESETSRKEERDGTGTGTPAKAGTHSGGRVLSPRGRAARGEAATRGPA